MAIAKPKRKKEVELTYKMGEWESDQQWIAMGFLQLRVAVTSQGAFEPFDGCFKY